MKNQTKLQQVLLPKVISVISIALLVILWEVSTSLKWVNPIFLPAPQSVFSTFMELLRDGYKGSSLTTHISASLYRLFTSLVIAFLTAVPLGIICGYSKYVLAIFDPIIEFYRPLPPLAYYALLVLWMGIDDRSKVALLYLSAFAPPLSCHCFRREKSAAGPYSCGIYTGCIEMENVVPHYAALCPS